MASLKKNFGYQIAYQILTVILPLITSPYLSRVIGSKGIGEYSFSYSVVYYFSLFVLLGVNNHGTRIIAKVREEKRQLSIEFWSVYFIQLFMGICTFLIYYVLCIFSNGDNLLAKIQILYLVSAVIDINWFFFGIENFKVTVIRNFIIKLSTVLLIFFCVKSPNDVWIYTFIMALSFLISQILLWPFLLRAISFIPLTEINIKKHIKPMLILFIPVVATSIFKYMDKIMLGIMCNKSELGLYDNSEKIMSIPLSLIVALGTVMLPRISNMISQNKKKEINQYMYFSMICSMTASCALAFGLAAIGPTFAPFFWGNEFEQCGMLIRYIAVTIIFISWANVLRTQYLIPAEKDSIFVKATIYGAVINFVINYTLITPLGALGTVIGTVVAEFIVAFYQTIKCVKNIPIKKYLIDCFPFLIIGTVMYFVVILVSRVPINIFLLLILEIVTGGSVYVTLCYVYIRMVKKITIRNLIQIIN